jgi:hypothetical protein
MQSLSLDLKFILYLLCILTADVFKSQHHRKLAGICVAKPFARRSRKLDLYQVLQLLLEVCSLCSREVFQWLFLAYLQKKWFKCQVFHQ